VVDRGILLAPSDSPWARWFYGEKRLKRALDPERHRASPGRIAAGPGAVAVAISALGTFGASTVAAARSRAA